MITGATKGKVDAIWQKMWEGGITNPIEVISQLTAMPMVRKSLEKNFVGAALRISLLRKCIAS